MPTLNLENCLFQQCSYKQVADVAVFSPPYKSKDGYSDLLMFRLGEKLIEVMKPNSWIFMNFGQLKEEFFRPFAAALTLKAGMKKHTEWAQTIIWVKSIVVDGVQRGHYQPINSPNILNYCHEYIFVFKLGNPTPLDRLSIGVEFKDKSNLKRGNRGKNGDKHCAGDVWYIPYETTGGSKKKLHSYEYPLELPLRCIKLSGAKAGVFDPFAGSGTTAIAAKKLGLDFYGTEMNKANCNVITSRWNNA